MSPTYPHHLISSTALIDIRIISLCATWYFISSLTSQSTKRILTQFNFPILVGECQFILSLLFGFSTLTVLSRFPSLKKNFRDGELNFHKFVFNGKLLKLFLPMGLFQFVGKLFSLAATSICPVATVASIRALGPLLIVLGYRTYYLVRFPLLTYLSLIPLLMGVIIIVISQSRDKERSLIDLNPFSNNSTMTMNQLDLAQQQLQLHQQHEHEQQLRDQMLLNIKGIAYALTAAIIFAGQSIYAKNVVSAQQYVDKSRLALSNNDNSSSDIELELDSKSDDLEKGMFNNSNNNKNDDDNKTTGMESYQLMTSMKKPMSSSNDSSSSNSDTDDIENNIYNNSHSRNANSSNNSHIEKPDKLTTLMYCALFGIVFSIPTFFIYEFNSLFFETNDLSLVDGKPNYLTIPWALMLLNGLSHFMQSLLAFHLLSILPTVTYSIGAMMKRIVIITVSMLLNGKKLSLLEITGLGCIMVGLYSYDRYGSLRKSM